MYKIMMTYFNPNENVEPKVVQFGPNFETEERAELFMLHSMNDVLSELNTPDENNTPHTGVFIADLNGEHSVIIRLWDGEDCRNVMFYDVEEILQPAQSIKVKVLNYMDYDTGKVMDSFVLLEEANLDNIAKKVEDVFREEEGSRPYCDIMKELYGDILLDVVESKKYDW